MARLALPDLIASPSRERAAVRSRMLPPARCPPGSLLRGMHQCAQRGMCGRDGGRHNRAMSLDQLTDRAFDVHALYDRINLRDRGRTWTREEFVLGLIGDVGDLAKLVMAAEGARELPSGPEAIGHELADCLWSVLVLARLYGVDLEQEFQHMTDDLERVLTSRLQT